MAISVLTSILFAGVLILMSIDKQDINKLRTVALYVTVLVFLLSQYFWISFDSSAAQFQFFNAVNWIHPCNIYIKLGLDGVSILLLILTTFLIPLCLNTAYDRITSSYKDYIIAFLVIEILLIYVFTVLDFVLFYIAFEAILIPMYLVIGLWGSRLRRIHASYQFFLFTLVGSVFFLIGILAIYLQVGTTDVTIVTFLGKFSTTREELLFIAFFLSFAVKVPMIPLHLWLPEAHVEAPTAGSIILAGILLKMGGYAMLRFSIPLFTSTAIYYTPVIFTICILGVIYASLTTLRQIDLKKIIAYSSVGHMSFVVLGFFTFTLQGLEGGMLYMISHGLVSSALFYCIGILYDRYHTKVIHYYSGLVNFMPIFATVFLFLILSNMSLPGTSSFVSEFLVIIGTFVVNTVTAFTSATGLVLCAAYCLWLYNRAIFGPAINKSITRFKDIDRIEFFNLMAFAVPVILIGLYPEVLIRDMSMSLAFLTSFSI